MRKRHMTIQMALASYTDLLKIVRVLKRKKNSYKQTDRQRRHESLVMKMLASTSRGQYLLPL